MQEQVKFVVTHTTKLIDWCKLENTLKENWEMSVFISQLSEIKHFLSLFKIIPGEMERPGTKQEVT